MPTRQQVRRMLGAGLDYAEAAGQLGIPPGQAYLIGTGRPGGGDSPSGLAEADGLLLASSQHLASPLQRSKRSARAGPARKPRDQHQP